MGGMVKDSVHLAGMDPQFIEEVIRPGLHELLNPDSVGHDQMDTLCDLAIEAIVKRRMQQMNPSLPAESSCTFSRLGFMVNA